MTKAVDLVTATAVWAGIGYLIDRWLGTWPILFAIGAVVGNFTGVYVLYKRSEAETDQLPAGYAGGVTRTIGRRPVPAAGGAIGRTNKDEDE